MPTWLAGSIYLPAGTYVGYHSYATNRDSTTWGPDANDFRPERWGHTHEQIFTAYRRAKARAEFISFHGGPRACLGEKFALLQVRITLLVLVRSLRWTLDPAWKDQMVPVCDAILFLDFGSNHLLMGLFRRVLCIHESCD